MIKNSFLKCFISFSIFSLLMGCGLTHVAPEKIMKINIIDRNGLSETVSTKERLSAFEKTDFLAPQPYQKVMRVYGREENGDTHSCITSYHPNGQLKQYLDSINNRAYGKYGEWYLNGKPKIEARVIGGIADLNTHAEESWLFDGTNKAWDEEGRLVAEISYQKGELEGESIYYHQNGNVWKRAYHKKNLPHGPHSFFLEDGTLFQTITYNDGLKEGPSLRYWNGSKIAYKELYEKASLVDGEYYDWNGQLISKINGGSGQRAIFGKQNLQELQEFRNGVQEGEVKVYATDSHPVRIYTIKNGEKSGEEISYFPHSSQQKLLLTWNEGLLHGIVKTWYANGNPESQKEISANKKNGLSMAWYTNGSLMLLEEYDNDLLIKGEYYRPSDKNAFTKVEKGKGIATLFNSDGNFLQKVQYQDGKPVEC